MTSMQTSISFDDFIVNKEKNTRSAMFSTGLFNEVQRYNAALRYNQTVKAEYDKYLDKQYENIPLRERLRLQNLTAEESQFLRLRDLAAKEDYDLNNGMFTLVANEDGTGYDIKQANQNTFNRSVHLLSGSTNRSSLLGYATTGIARTFDAQMINNAPEWAKADIQRILEQSIGGDVLQAIEEDYQGVSSFTGFFIDLFDRSRDPERDMKFIGKESNKYNDALQYQDDSWTPEARDKFYEQMMADESWGPILQYAGITRDVLDRSNNIAHAQYIINGSITGKSLADNQPHFSSFGAFMYSLPMALIDDPETAAEITLSGLAAMASAVIPPMAGVAAAGFTMTTAKGIHKINKIVGKSGKLKKAVDALHSIDKVIERQGLVKGSLTLGFKTGEVTSAGITKLNKVINPFEVVSELGIPSMMSLLDVAKGRSTFKTAFASRQARLAIDKGYNWRYFIAGSAAEGTLSEFGVYFANLDATKETADLLYGEGNHMVDFSFGQLAADSALGGAFGVALGSTMRGVFAGANALGVRAFTPLGSRVAAHFNKPDSFWMNAIHGYRRVSFQIHAEGVVDLDDVEVARKLDEALFESEDSLVSQGFGHGDILAAARTVGRQHRESNPDKLMDPGMFVDHVKRVAESDRKKLLYAAHHSHLSTSKKIKANEKRINSLERALKRAPDEAARKGIQKKIDKLHKETKDLRSFTKDAATATADATKALAWWQARKKEKQQEEVTLTSKGLEILPGDVLEQARRPDESDEAYIRRLEATQQEAEDAYIRSLEEGVELGEEAYIRRLEQQPTPRTPEALEARTEDSRAVTEAPMEATPEAPVEATPEAARLEPLNRAISGMDKAKQKFTRDVLRKLNKTNFDTELDRVKDFIPEIVDNPEVMAALREFVNENDQGPDIDVTEVTAPEAATPEAPVAETPAAETETPRSTAASQLRAAATERKRERKAASKTGLKAKVSSYTPAQLAERIIKLAKTYHLRRKRFIDNSIKRWKNSNMETIPRDVAIAMMPEAEYTFRNMAKDGNITIKEFEKTVNRVHEENMKASEDVDFNNIQRFLIREHNGDNARFDNLVMSELAFNRDFETRLNSIREANQQKQVGRKSAKETEALRKKLRGIKQTNDSTEDIPTLVTIEDFLAAKGARRAIMEARILAEAVSSIKRITDFNGDGKVSFNDIIRSMPPGFEVVAEQLRNNLTEFADGRYDSFDVINEIVSVGLQRQLNKDHAEHYEILVSLAPDDVSVIKARSEDRMVRDEALQILDHLNEEVQVGQLIASRRREAAGQEFNEADNAAGWNQKAVLAGKAALDRPRESGISKEKLEQRYGTTDSAKILEMVIEEFNAQFKEYADGDITPFMALGNGTLDYIDPVTAIIALLQAATGSPEGHATRFTKNITEFGDDGSPLPSKTAKGTVIVNEFSPTNTAKRIQMYEEFIYQDRINRILYDEEGNPRELSEEELDIAEAWFRYDPKQPPKNYKAEREKLNTEIKALESALGKIPKDTKAAKSLKRIETLTQKIEQAKENKRLLALEQKALQVHGPKTLKTKDRVVNPTIRAPRLVPRRVLADIDQQMPGYDEYLLNAYEDMMVATPALIQFVHDQVIFAENMGFLFGSPRTMKELQEDTTPEQNDLIKPFARIKGKDGEDIPGAVTLGMATATVMPGSFGDFMNRAAEMLFPNLLGVSERARQSWIAVWEGKEVKDLSNQWFNDGSQIKDRDGYKQARQQVEEIAKAKESTEPMTDTEKAEMTALLYIMSGDQWDATASGNSIMMASQVKIAQLANYLASNERYQDLLTSEERDIDMYLLVKDALGKELNEIDETALSDSDKDSLEWWINNVFSDTSVVSEKVLRKELFKIPVMARSYGIGEKATKEHVVAFITKVFVEGVPGQPRKMMNDGDLSPEKIDRLASFVTKRMVDTGDNTWKGTITKALGLPRSKELVKQFQEGHDITINYNVRNEDGSFMTDSKGSFVMNTERINFEKALRGEINERTVSKEALSAVAGMIFTDSSNSEVELEYMGFNTVLQMARQAAQYSRLIEGDEVGKQQLIAAGKPVTFQDIFTKLVKDYSNLVEKAQEMAKDPAETRSVSQIIRDFLIAAKQNSLKIEGLNYMRRRVKKGNKDMAEAYAAIFGFRLEDMDPRMRLSLEQGMYSDYVGYQENRQESTDGTMGTEVTRIRSSDKPGAVFSIVDDLYDGKTAEEARKDVRRRAITQALIDASRYRRFDGREDPTLEDFYENVRQRDVQPEDTDMNRMMANLQATKLAAENRLAQLKNAEDTTGLSEAQKQELDVVKSKLAMIKAAEDSFLKNNENFSPNLAHRKRHIATDSSLGRIEHDRDNLSDTVSFSQQQDGFHGAFPEYARRTLGEVMGVPALRQFALTRSRFGSNVKTLTEDKPPIIDMSNKGLAEASELSLDPEGYVRGSVLDLLGDPGLSEISVLERSVQLEIKIIRAAIAAGKGSRLYNILNPKGGEDITQIEANRGDIALAYQYLAREEILERGQRRMASAIESAVGNQNRTLSPIEQEQVAAIIATVKTEMENEFQTLFSGFGRASMDREVPVLELDPGNYLAKIARGSTVRDSITGSTKLQGSQAERTNALQMLFPDAVHTARIIYEGTKGSVVEGGELIAGGKSDNAESALAPLMAFHSDSFQIIVPSAFFDRFISGKFDAAADTVAPVLPGISDGTKTWNQLIKEGVITRTSAVNKWLHHQLVDLGQSRDILLALTRNLNDQAGDQGFPDIDLINQWGINLTIVDDNAGDIADPEVIQQLSQGAISIDTRAGENNQPELTTKALAEMGRPFDSPTKTWLNGFGEEVKTHRTKGDIKISLTRNQKAIALAYSKNNDIILDMELLNIINVNELVSRQAQSSRVSEYIPDMLMERTNIQQLPAGSLDMHIRYLAQLDAQALKMIQPGKPKTMTDSRQSGMDEEGNLVKDRPAEYLLYEDLKSLDKMIYEDQIRRYMDFQVDADKTWGSASRPSSNFLPRKSTKTEKGEEIRNMTDDEYFASISVLYGIGQSFTHLVMGFLGQSKVMQDRITSGLGYRLGDIDNVANLDSKIKKATDDLNKLKNEAMKERTPELDQQIKEQEARLQALNKTLNDVDPTVARNATEIIESVKAANFKALRMMKKLQEIRTEQFDLLIAPFKNELSVENLAQLDKESQVYYTVKMFLGRSMPHSELRKVSERLWFMSHTERVKRQKAEDEGLTPQVENILRDNGTDLDELESLMDAAEESVMDEDLEDLLDAAAVVDIEPSEMEVDNVALDVDTAEEEPSVGVSPVQLVLKDRLIQLKRPNYGPEEMEFNTIHDLNLWLINESKKDGLTDSDREKIQSLDNLLKSVVKLEEEVTDLRIRFSLNHTTPMYDATTGVTPSIVLPSGRSVDKTIDSLMHEFFHHLVRRSFLRMGMENYKITRRNILTLIMDDDAFAETLQDPVKRSKEIKTLFYHILKDDPEALNDIIKRADDIYKLHGQDHLEYYLVQEFLAYGMVQAVQRSGSLWKPSDSILEDYRMYDILADFIIRSKDMEYWSYVTKDLSDVVINLITGSARKTTFDPSPEPDIESGEFGMTLYDVTHGARVDGGPHQERLVSLSQRLAAARDALDSLPPVEPNQVDPYRDNRAHLNQIIISLSDTITRIEKDTSILGNDRNLQAAKLRATNESGEIDADKMSLPDKQAVAVERLIELGVIAEIEDGTSSIQRVLDSLGISTTGMNRIRASKIHLVQALGTMLNAEQVFAPGRFGATRGMMTLQSIMLMENGQVDRIAHMYHQTLTELKELGMGTKSLNENLHLFMTVPNLEKHMDPKLYAIIRPVGEALKNYYQNVAQRAYDEGLITADQRIMMEEGSVPFRITTAALNDADAIDSIRTALIEEYRNKLQQTTDDSIVSAVVMIAGRPPIMPRKTASREEILNNHRELVEYLWRKEDPTRDKFESTQITHGELLGLLDVFRTELYRGRIKIKDLPAGVQQKYRDAVGKDESLDTAKLEEMHDDYEIGYIPQSGVRASEYHAGRAMWHLKNDSYAFEDRLLDFHDLSKNSIMRPYIEFNPLKMVRGLRQGLSFRAYERMMIRKNLGIRGVGFKDLIEYTRNVLESGTDVPTIRDGEVVSRILNSDEMKELKYGALDTLLLHRDHARGKTQRPQDAGAAWNTLYNVSNTTLRFFGQPFWTSASFIVEGGLAFYKQMSRALRGPIIEMHKAFADMPTLTQTQALEMLGIYTYSVGASIDNAKFGGQDVSSLDVIFDMIEAEVAGDVDGSTTSKVNQVLQNGKKGVDKAVEWSRFGFDPLQRLLRAIEVQPAIQKLGRDIRHFSKFIDALEGFIEENGRSPDKKEKFRLMRENNLGNTAADMHRVNKYIDAGLMDKDVMNALIAMIADQSGKVFSFDEAMHKFYTFAPSFEPGDQAKKDANLKALMAFRHYLVMEATDTNLEVGVGDKQVLAAGTIWGRFMTRLTQYATLAYRMFRNLLFAAPASIIMGYFAAYYMLENLYTSLSRIAKGRSWRDEMKRWTAFQEKPAETVATYVTAGVALPQIGGQLSIFASSSLNVILNKIFGLDTPGYMMTPGGASMTGFMTAIDAISSIPKLASNFMNDEPMDPKSVNKLMAFGSFGGVTVVGGRLVQSLAQQEQSGLQGQAQAARSRGRQIPYIPVSEIYKPDTTIPVFNPLEEYRNAPVIARPEMFPYPGQTVQPTPQRVAPQMAASQELPQRVTPQEQLFESQVQETPGSLFDQR